MRGVVVGGWNYVIAAYSITTTMLVIYAVSLFIRLTEAQRRADSQSAPGRLESRPYVDRL